MTAEERRARGRQLCRKLSGEIAEVAPDGIGRWQPAWRIVARADADFLATLTAWESDPTERRRGAVRAAYQAVLAAWREAARRYRREGASR